MDPHQYPPRYIGANRPFEFGKYDLTRRIGKGGMGEVFEAWPCIVIDDLRERDDRPVALKVPSFELLERDSTFANEFLREAKAALRARHKNVVRLRDAGQVSGIPYLAMELLEGEDLASRLVRGALPPKQVLALCEELCAGLAAIHKAKLLHLDLKPANIFLTRSSGVRIVDLGLAKLRQGSSGRSHVNAGGAGSLPYMAPEQLDSRTRQTRQTDLYALACVISEMTLGAPVFPHDATTTEILFAVHDCEKHVAEQDLGLRLDAVIPGLGPVIVACLRKDPSQRPATVESLAAGLAALEVVDEDDVTEDGPAVVSGPALSSGPPPRTPVYPPTQTSSAEAPAMTATPKATATPPPISPTQALPKSASSRSTPHGDLADVSRPIAQTKPIPFPDLSVADQAAEQRRAMASAAAQHEHMAVDNAKEGGGRRLVVALAIGGVLAAVALCGVGGLGVAGMSGAFATGSSTPDVAVAPDAPDSPDGLASGLGVLDSDEPAVAVAEATPDVDPDGDGIVGDADRCPDESETMNDFQDADGCPDQAPPADADGDGIDDSKDACPSKPETKNDFEDQDGCPDKKPVLAPAVEKSAYPMVLKRSGTFMMGSPETEPGHVPVEHQRKTQVSQDFYVGRFEVTQGLYRSVVKTNPSRFTSCGPQCPVEKVSWVEAVQFANELSKQQGLELCYLISGDNVTWPKGLSCEGYRLPTSAEWEFAGRGGGDTTYSGGSNVEVIAWVRSNSGGRTHKVGGKPANAIGLFDMSGNVMEWCWDVRGGKFNPSGPPSKSDRVLRGGGWNSTPNSARMAYQGANSLLLKAPDVGFRLVRTAN